MQGKELGFCNLFLWGKQSKNSYGKEKLFLMNAILVSAELQWKAEVSRLPIHVHIFYIMSCMQWMHFVNQHIESTTPWFRPDPHHTNVQSSLDYMETSSGKLLLIKSDVYEMFHQNLFLLFLCSCLLMSHIEISTSENLFRTFPKLKRSPFPPPYCTIAVRSGLNDSIWSLWDWWRQSSIAQAHGGGSEDLGPQV